jgi:uncharacterized Ntn-hydrolase superfamily protein
MRKAAVYLGSRAVDEAKVAAYLRGRGVEAQTVFANMTEVAENLTDDFSDLVIYDEPDKLPELDQVFALTQEHDTENLLLLTPEDIEPSDRESNFRGREG